MSGTPDTEDRDGPTAAAPGHPTLEPDERLWLESYLERLKEAPGGLLQRLVVYGSKARGDAGPASDVDVLVLVGDVPDAVGSARNLIYGDDDPDGVDHNVVVRTEADWLQDLEKELPFPRNVDAEGVQIHPVHRPARRPPGDRPPVTRKGIRHAVPVWLKKAGSDMKTLAYEIKELKDGRFKYPGMAARPAFDAVFFSAMAWCLTRGVSVVRRKDLATSVERHLIGPGALDPGWRNRIRMVWSAWKAEVDWQRGRGRRADGRRRRRVDRGSPGVLRARPRRDRSRRHRGRPSRRSGNERERRRNGGGAVSGRAFGTQKPPRRGWVAGIRPT